MPGIKAGFPDRLNVRLICTRHGAREGSRYRSNPGADKNRYVQTVDGTRFREQLLMIC